MDTCKEVEVQLHGKTCYVSSIDVTEWGIAIRFSEDFKSCLTEKVANATIVYLNSLGITAKGV